MSDLRELVEVAATYVAANDHALNQPDYSDEAWQDRADTRDAFDALVGPRQGRDDITVQVARLVSRFAEWGAVVEAAAAVVKANRSAGTLAVVGLERLRLALDATEEGES